MLLLGRVIKGRPEAERVSLVSEALGGKSVSTLKKRLSSLTKLVGWCSAQGMSAFPLDSQVLIEYTGHLLSTGARHSAFGSCLESCNFARHILGLDVVGEPLKHPLIQGRVRNVRFHRPPRKQARPFQVREVAFWRPSFKILLRMSAIVLLWERACFAFTPAPGWATSGLLST